MIDAVPFLATPFLGCLPPLAFAHRGYAQRGDENSMAAFQRAVDLGFRYLETDVRVTADGVALAFHDPFLDRVTDRHGRISAQPWSVVRTARIRGREPIPLLTDVLAAWPDVRVNLDVKAEATIGPTIEAIRRTGSIDRVCVAAFSDARVAAVRRALGPRLTTALGPREAFALVRAARRGRTLTCPTGQCAQVPPQLGRIRFVTPSLVQAAHECGLQVHAWTVNRRDEMQRLLDLGVDGIVTDEAETLRDLLSERGQWAAA
jgi:glycerophosphoryl diester phosphodiesterase